jgi:hypothetical protein
VRQRPDAQHKQLDRAVFEMQGQDVARLQAQGRVLRPRAHEKLEPTREELARGSLEPRQPHSQTFVLLTGGPHLRVINFRPHVAATCSLPPSVEAVVESAVLQQGRHAF